MVSFIKSTGLPDSCSNSRGNTPTHLNNGKHGDIHEYTLDEEGRLVVVAEPEKYSECVRHKKGQANVDGKALRRLLLHDLNVLRNIGHNTPEYHR